MDLVRASYREYPQTTPFLGTWEIIQVAKMGVRDSRLLELAIIFAAPLSAQLMCIAVVVE